MINPQEYSYQDVTNHYNVDVLLWSKGSSSKNCIGKITNIHDEVVIFPIKIGKKKKKGDR